MRRLRARPPWRGGDRRRRRPRRPGDRCRRRDRPAVGVGRDRAVLRAVRPRRRPLPQRSSTSSPRSAARTSATGAAARSSSATTPADIDAVEARLHARRGAAPEMGDIERLDDAGLGRLFPPLRTGLHGVWVPGGARVDGRLLVAGVLAAIERLGGTVRHGEVALRRDADRVVAEVDGERLAGDRLVVAGGAWAAECSRRSTGPSTWSRSAARSSTSGSRASSPTAGRPSCPSATTTSWPSTAGASWPARPARPAAASTCASPPPVSARSSTRHWPSPRAWRPPPWSRHASVCVRWPPAALRASVPSPGTTASSSPAATARQASRWRPRSATRSPSSSSPVAHRSSSRRSPS